MSPSMCFIRSPGFVASVRLYPYYIRDCIRMYLGERILEEFSLHLMLKPCCVSWCSTELDRGVQLTWKHSSAVLLQRKR